MIGTRIFRCRSLRLQKVCTHWHKLDRQRGLVHIQQASRLMGDLFSKRILLAEVAWGSFKIVLKLCTTNLQNICSVMMSTGMLSAVYMVKYPYPVVTYLQSMMSKKHQKNLTKSSRARRNYWLFFQWDIYFLTTIRDSNSKPRSHEGHPNI